MQHNLGFILLSRLSVGAVLLISLPGCANHVRVAGFGDLPAPGEAQAYRLAVTSDSKRDQQETLIQGALSAALAQKGLTADSNAAMRLEAGFAIRSPRQTLANGMATARAFRPFCRRQLYVLSLVVSERQSGRILAERQASAMRCRWTTPEAIARLANAAITEPLRPKFTTTPPPVPSAVK